LLYKDAMSHKTPINVSSGEAIWSKAQTMPDTMITLVG
jgi:hypothetical protein